MCVIVLFAILVPDPFFLEMFPHFHSNQVTASSGSFGKNRSYELELIMGREFKEVSPEEVFFYNL